jgi:hypothetical protein
MPQQTVPVPATWLKFSYCFLKPRPEAEILRSNKKASGGTKDLADSEELE